MVGRRLVFAAGAIQRIFETLNGHPGTGSDFCAHFTCRAGPRFWLEVLVRYEAGLFQQRRAVQAAAKTFCQG